ncbi:MAG: alpha-L-glutamate ligase, partial [Methylotenera sp.]|nr:alpha-L-glutamate ligase [Methylotenera sp.]
MKIPIFTEDPGWHGLQLKQAFAERDVEAIFIPLNDCSLHITHDQNDVISIPFFERLPRGAFVRGIQAGTLQQVMTRLNILHMLQQSDVVIYNQPKAIERTVDKAMTSFLLHKNNVPTPATWICESRKEAENTRQMMAEQQQPLVIKPLFGSQGIGVRKLSAQEILPVPMQQFVDGVYYLQQLI